MEQVISAVDAQSKFGKILETVGQSGQETVIQRNNQPVAVLISYRQYRQFLAFQRQAEIQKERFAIYDEIRARNPDAAPQDVIADVAEAVTAIRAA